MAAIPTEDLLALLRRRGVEFTAKEFSSYLRQRHWALRIKLKKIQGQKRRCLLASDVSLAMEDLQPVT